MGRPRQLLLSEAFRLRLVHGGEHSLGKRKERRPFSSRQTLHLVLRSSQAQGDLSLRLPRHRAFIRQLISRLACRYRVRIYESSIQTNHIHLLVRTKTRAGFQNFLRTLAGHIAQRITKAVRGKPFGKFWDLLTFSRLVPFGRAYDRAKAYVLMNEGEARGLIAYRPRERKPPCKPGTSNNLVAFDSAVL